MTIDAPQVALISLRPLEPSFGHALDGILGFGLFSSYVVEIDYEARRVSLYAPEGFVYSGDGAAVPLEVEKNQFFIKATVVLPGRGPLPGRFLVGSLASSEFDGIVGGELLRRFHTVFDARRRRLFLRLNGAFREPYEHNVSGLGLRAEGDGFRILKIHRVIPGSAADSDLPAVPAGRAFAHFHDGARRSEADGQAHLAASGVTTDGLSVGFQPPSYRE